jgi:SsrA-binding protein
MKIIQKNKQAYFDYEILDEYKAGIVLTGPEIKSVRLGNINLRGSHVSLLKGQAYLKNANISRYKYDSSLDYAPFRERKLLLKESELKKIAGVLNTKGVLIAPLAIGLEGKYAKLQIGIVRGKKQHDKRQTIKEREVKRRMDRVVRR